MGPFYIDPLPASSAFPTDQLHAGRIAAGALELASAELRFSTEADTGMPRDVLTKQKVGMGDPAAVG